MSLEQTLDRTNTLLEKLLAVLESNAAATAQAAVPQAPASAAAEPTRRRGRPPKAETQVSAEQPAAAAPTATEQTATEQTATEQTATAPTTAEGAPLGLVEGDPVGTRYFVVERYNTVYAQRPGDPDCTIAGAEIVSAEHYLAKKNEFQSKFKSATVVDPTTVPAPTSAPTPVAAAPALAADNTPWATVIAKFMELNKSPEPGHGREGVVSVLKQFLPGVDKPNAAMLQPLGKNAEVVAAIEALLAPKAIAAPAPAAGEFDPLA